MRIMRYQGLPQFDGTEPAAAGLLAGLLVLLLALVACDTGCVSYARLLPAPRALAQQYNGVILVEALCLTSDPFEHVGDSPAQPVTPTVIFGGVGSGVIIDARHALTAYHVAGGCPYLADVHIVTSTGRRLRVVVEHEWRDWDVVRLEIASAETFGSVPPPLIRAPVVGDEVCTSVAWPKFGGHCGGTVTQRLPNACTTDDGRQFCVDTRLNIAGESGNSGGAIYAGDGALIGLVTATSREDGAAAGHSLPPDVLP